MRKIARVETRFGMADLEIDRYKSSGYISLRLIGKRGEVITTFSTNLPMSNFKVGADELTVKTWDENAYLVEPMLKTGLFLITNRTCRNGFVDSPVWKIRDPSILPEKISA